MKTIFLATAIAFAFTVSSRSETTAKISEVHLCCKSCVSGAQKAIDKVEGVKVVADQDAETLTLTGPDAATVQKAADALVAAGYFGKSDNKDVKLTAHSGASGKKVQTLELEGVHLCCKSCVTAVDRAVKGVAGVKEHTAVQKAKAFTVTGDFNDQEVFDALQKTGLSGKVATPAK